MQEISIVIKKEKAMNKETLDLIDLIEDISLMEESTYIDAEVL